MKKLILLFICIVPTVICYPVFAAEAAPDDSNWGIQPVTKDWQRAQQTSSSEKAWDEEVNEKIYENYGSEASPAFLNRENINPGESDYDYGSGDGLD